MLRLYVGLCWCCREGCLGVVGRVVLRLYLGLCSGCKEGCLGVVWKVVCGCK